MVQSAVGDREAGGCGVRAAGGLARSCGSRKRVAAYYWWLFPNTMLNFYPWGLSVNVVRPLGVDRTKVSFLTYVWREELVDKRGRGAGWIGWSGRMRRWWRRCSGG